MNHVLISYLPTQATSSLKYRTTDKEGISEYDKSNESSFKITHQHE